MKLTFTPDHCSGCRICEVVCSLENWNVLNPKKAALRVTGRFPVPGRYTLAFCDQCGECAGVCPTGCIQQDDQGAWIIQAESCIGCGVCVAQCPQGAMYLHEDHGEVPIKCTLCGKCAEFCPTGALVDADGAILPRR